jgi:hypothetical protein
MKRALLGLVLTTAAAGVLAPDASAQPITGVCSFPLEVTPLVSNEVARVTLPNGVVIQTGRFTVRLTNADIGTTINLNVSGPVFTDAAGNSTYRGEALLFFGQQGDLYLTSGTVVFGPSGVLSETGTRRNICALLE